MEALKRFWIGLLLLALVAAALPVQALTCTCGCRPSAPAPVVQPRTSRKARCGHCHAPQSQVPGGNSSLSAPQRPLFCAHPHGPAEPCHCQHSGLPASCASGSPVSATSVVPAPPVHPESRAFVLPVSMGLEQDVPALAVLKEPTRFGLPRGWRLPRSPHLLPAHLNLPPPSLT